MLETLASIDWAAIIAVITTITTAIAGIIAAIQNIGKKNAESELAETQAFFDPNDTEVMTPTDSTPEASWKMSTATRASILEGKSDEDKVSIIQQIDDAEKAGYVDYKIVCSNGYYNITYGLIESQNITETVVTDSREETELGRAMIQFEAAIAAGKVKLDNETEYYVNKDDVWYFTAWPDGRYSFHSPWHPEKAIALSSL